MGVYIKADGTTAELTQCSDPKYAVGYCKGKDGKNINYPARRHVCFQRRKRA